MAYEIPGFVFSMKSSGAIRQYRAVVVGAGPVVTEIASADVKISGIAQMPAEADNPETIRVMKDGVSFAIAGGDVTAGDQLATDNQGRLVTVASQTNIVGRALTSGAVGEVISVLLD